MSSPAGGSPDHYLTVPGARERAVSTRVPGTGCPLLPRWLQTKRVTLEPLGQRVRWGWDGTPLPGFGNGRGSGLSIQWPSPAATPGSPHWQAASGLGRNLGWSRLPKSCS